MTLAVRIGVLRLVDSAPVLVARERGLFDALGLDVEVSVEPSWANAADKLTYGLLDAAIMLPPLVLAAAMGLRGPKARLVVPMGLSQGGNAVVLGNPAANSVAAAGCPRGRMLGDWLRLERRRLGVAPRFAVVHHFSTHNLLLRYWLAGAGVDPDRDIETVVVPPEQVVDALASGRIAGFCAGAPWGDAAEQAGAGRVLLGSSRIWPAHPEKCLALGQTWAESHPDAARRLIRALLRAQILCDMPSEAPSIAALLAHPDELGLPEGPTRAALAEGVGAEQIRFHAGAAWFPARTHALWFLTQMRRWGWIDAGVDLDQVARSVYRPDLLAAVAAEEGIPACVATAGGLEPVWLPTVFPPEQK